MTDQRFEKIYQSASKLLIKQGYKNTQVSDIAKDAGIATGSIYNLFAGKKAILTFVVYYNLMDGQIDISSPLAPVDTSLMVERLKAIVDPFLEELQGLNKEGHPNLSFEEMLSTLFDLVAKYQQAFSIINDHKSVLAEVEAVYRRYVDELYRIILRNLEAYKKRGSIRSIDYLPLHIRNILEGITWWAMYVPYQDDMSSISITQEEAKTQALAVLTKGYIEN